MAKAATLDIDLDAAPHQPPAATGTAPNKGEGQ